MIYVAPAGVFAAMSLTVANRGQAFFLVVVLGRSLWLARVPIGRLRVTRASLF